MSRAGQQSGEEDGTCALRVPEGCNVPVIQIKILPRLASNTALLSRSKALPERLPAFYSYLLDYPKAALPDSSSVFYWEKVKFGLKPTLRINHQIAAHAAGEHGSIDVVAIKQLYASHYFQTALDLNFCVPGKDRGFYLVTVKGSEQAGLTGAKGSVIRKVAVDKTRSSLEKSLEAIKQQLEK